MYASSSPSLSSSDYTQNVPLLTELNKWSKDHDDYPKAITMLKNSHVYAQEVDENDNPTGQWFSIVGLTDHGPNITLKIRKPNGKIEV